LTQINIQKILIAPLDWGLGHATRCIPIIRCLRAAGYTVIIAAADAQSALLKAEFPDLQQVFLPGYRIQYARTRGWLPFKILSQLPRLFKQVKQEHEWLDQQIDRLGIDCVISDNRYGLYSSRIPSVIITHQLLVKAPFRWVEHLVQKRLYTFINRFTMCWVPDIAAGGGLAGILSHPPLMPRIPVAYMGLLCRFRPRQKKETDTITLLLSGPEPQRSLMEQQFLKAMAALPEEQIVLVRGLPDSNEKDLPPNVVNHLPTPQLQELLDRSKLVVCRGGYTSLMELMSLQIPLVLVPTPGQTEQEYLAWELGRSNKVVYMTQQHFDLKKAMQASDMLPAHDIQITIFGQEKMTSLMMQLQEHWQ
jgi:uncharacterized protein (TIGR00661 family)